MVEAYPMPPGRFIVALPAVFAEIATMGIVRAMTIYAIGTDLPCFITGKVAGFAGDIGMSAPERETGFSVVVELGQMPAFATVTILAFFYIRTPVSVVFAMAGVTTSNAIPIFLAGLVSNRMAGVAGLITVQAVKPELGIPVVIEAGFAPFLFGMAGFALAAESIVVDVPDLVATNAGFRSAFEFALNVAGVAVDLAV